MHSFTFKSIIVWRFYVFCNIKFSNLLITY